MIFMVINHLVTKPTCQDSPFWLLLTNHRSHTVLTNGYTMAKQLGYMVG